MVSKISAPKLKELARLFTETFLSREEIAKEIGFEPSCLSHFLGKAQEEGFIDKASRASALKRRKNKRMIDKRAPFVSRASLDYCFFRDSVDEILKNYEISRNTLTTYLRESLEKGVISQADLDSARGRRSHREYRITPEVFAEILDHIQQEVAQHRSDEDFVFTISEDLAKEQGVSSSALIARLNKVRHQRSDLGKMVAYRNDQVKKQAAVRSGLAAYENGTGIHSLEREVFVETGRRNGNALASSGRGPFGFSREQRVANSRRGGTRAKELGKGVHGLSVEQLSEAGKKGALAIHIDKKGRKNLYNVEGRFEADSMAEGAVALTLEKYVPGYEIQEGDTFQNPGDTAYVHDFVLDDAILEWHPIRLDLDGKKHTNGNYQALKELEAEAETDEDMAVLREMKKEVGEDAAINYWISRQENSDNSEYFNGKEVELVRNSRDLYDFLKEKGAALPTYTNFRREFNEAKEYVRTFKSQKKEEVEVVEEVA